MAQRVVHISPRTPLGERDSIGDTKLPFGSRMAHEVPPGVLMDGWGRWVDDASRADAKSIRAGRPSRSWYSSTRIIAAPALTVLITDAIRQIVSRRIGGNILGTAHRLSRPASRSMAPPEKSTPWTATKAASSVWASRRYVATASSVG